MLSTNSLHGRKLEIMRALEFFKEQIRFYPIIRREAQFQTVLLEGELEDLEWEFRQQTNNPRMY